MERLRYYKRSLSLSELLSELQQAKAITNFHKRSYSIIMVCLRSRSQEEDLNTSDTEGDAEMICREQKSEKGREGNQLRVYYQDSFIEHNQSIIPRGTSGTQGRNHLQTYHIYITTAISHWKKSAPIGVNSGYFQHKEWEVKPSTEGGRPVNT